MTKCFTALLLAFSAFSRLIAQAPCGADLLHQKALNNPDFAQKNAIFEENILSRARAGQAEKATTVTLPVVVHVVHNNGPENISDTWITTAIQQLNEAFANSGYYDQGTGTNTMIQFCLAQRTPDELPTNGITRTQNVLTEMDMSTEDDDLKNLSRWDPTRYINIWLVREICDGPGCGVAGYAYFPSAHGSDIDGIVMEAEYMGSSPGNTGVLAHEMGHYLGLYHTFQGGCTNNDCLTDGDRVCDTPPDQSTAWLPCSATPNTCSTDVLSGFSTDQNDMISNFMDYSDLNCFHDFTPGQSDRMHAALQTVRQSLLTSKGCLSPCPNPVEAAFTYTPTDIYLYQTVPFTNTSTGGVDYQWSINGTPFSTAANPSYLFDTGGEHTVTLFAAGNPSDLCFDTFSLVIDVICLNNATFTASAVTIQPGETVFFTNTSQGGIAFEWFVNGIAQATTYDFSFVFTNEGIYDVTLVAPTLAATLCPPATFTQRIEVRCAVVADFTPSTYNPEPGQTVSFANNSLNYNTIEWFVNGVSQGAALPSYTFPTPGVYVVSLTAGNGACEKTRTHYISVIDTCSAVTFQKTYGNALENVGVRAAYLDDGTLLIAGNTFDADNTTDVVFLKLDGAGNPIWSKRWGTPGTSEAVNHLRAVAGGQFAATMNTTTFGTIDPVFARFDAAGNVLWQKTVQTLRDDQFNGFNQTSDGGFILTGALRPSGGWDTYFLKLDAFGNQQWARLYNGGNTDFHNDIVELPGGGYISTGFTLSYGQNTNTIHDGVITRLDASGNVVWTRAYGQTGNEGFGRIFLTADGGYIVFGGSESYNGGTITTFDDIWVMKTDGNGVIQWSKVYRTDQNIDCTVRGATEANGGGYVLSGNDFGANGTFETFYLKINNTGDVAWSRMYGGAGIDRVVDVAATPNGYLLPGSSNSIGAGNFDLHVIKTDNEGNAGDCLSVPHTLTTEDVQPIVEDGTLNNLNPPVLQTVNLPVQTLSGFTQTALCADTCSTEVCFNGIDDDGDGLFDCLDPDCDCFTCEPSNADLWYFGEKSGLDFRQDPPVVLTDGQTTSKEGTAVMTDPLGQLLFYAEGDNVFNRNHTVMPNGWGLAGNTSSSQLLIVPHPGNPTQFFVFTPYCLECPGNTGLSYSVVDMTLNGGYGDVVAGQKNLPLTPKSDLSELLTGVRHCNGKAYWVVNHSGVSNAYYAWLIDDSGLNTTPVVSFTGQPAAVAGTYGDNYGQMKFSPDGNRLARAMHHSNGIELCDFDPQTGVVSNARTLTMPGMKAYVGVEFSPSGRMLYTTNHLPPTRLIQFDLANSDAPTVLYEIIDAFRIAQMQLAPNGKIYFTHNTSGAMPTPFLSVIHQPDVPGTGCQFVNFGQSLNGVPGAALGLPNFLCDVFWKPSLRFKTVPATDTLCQPSATRTFYLEKLSCAVDTVLWQVSGNASITSIGRDSITLTYGTAGDIRLIARAVAACGEATDTMHFTVVKPDVPVLDLGPDIAWCDNGVATLNAGSGWSSYRWNNLSTDSTVTAWYPGWWRVEVRDVCGNLHTDSVLISVLPATTLALTDTLSLCPGQPSTFNLPPPFVSWQWFPATGLVCADCPEITVETLTDTLQYVAVARTAEGCYSSDTVVVVPDGTLVLASADTVFCEGTVLFVYGTPISADTSFQVLLPSANGCDTLLSLQATTWPAYAQTNTLSACPGQTAVFNGQNLVPGNTYSFPFSSVNGCDSLWTVNVELLDTSVQHVSLSACPGETVFFNGQPLTLDTSYTFVFQNIAGCDSTWVVQTPGFQLPPFSLGADAFVCQSQVPSYDLPAGYASWTWSPATAVDCANCLVVTPLPVVGSTVFVVEAVSDEGCTVFDTLTVTVYADTVYLSVDTSFCSGSTLTVLGQPVSTDTVLTVFAPGTGSCDTLWTVSAQVLPVVETDLFFEACTGDTVQTQGVGLPAGAVQTFVYTGVTGCDSTVHVTVGVLDSVLTHVTLFACADQTVSWNGQELAPGAVASVVFSTPDGCDSTVIAAVMSLPGPTVDLPSEVVLPVGQTLQLSPNVTGQGPFAYSWQPAALVDCPTCMSAIAQVPSDVWIALTVTDGQGCRAADSVWVRLSNPEDTCGIYVPNAFLPDDDGRNDFFYPSAGPCVQAVSYLRVYDRWGELVFERTDFPPDTEHLGWNGRFNDNDAPAAVYVWVIEIRTLDGIRRIFTGDLTLLR